jgi:cyanophycin synthetase
VPLAHQTFALENVLAAVAAGWALGIGSDLLQAGIETFEYEAAAS